MTVTNRAILCLVAIFQLVCFCYDALLLSATYQHRKRTSLPLAYVTVMSLSGCLVTIFMTMNMFFYMILNDEEYEVYLIHFGAEASIGSTFSYLNTIMVTVLMTCHRLSVVLWPFNQWFTHKKIFIYCFFIAILVLSSLLIPYFSNCSITFMLNRLAFISACAPDRHPITTFQNTYAIVLPLSCMVINVGIVSHLRFRKDNGYAKIRKTLIDVIGFCLCRMSCGGQGSSNKIGALTAVTVPVTIMAATSTPVTVIPTTAATPYVATGTTSSSTDRKDFAMMRQTLSIAIFLSIYELGSFFTRLFPKVYADLPVEAQDAYFYVRMESIALMNFFIYYVNNSATRRMLHAHLGIKPKPSNAVTVFTLAQRNVQQTQTIRMT